MYIYNTSMTNGSHEFLERGKIDGDLHQYIYSIILVGCSPVIIMVGVPEYTLPTAAESLKRFDGVLLANELYLLRYRSVSMFVWHKLFGKPSFVVESISTTIASKLVYRVIHLHHGYYYNLIFSRNCCVIVTLHFYKIY